MIRNKATIRTLILIVGIIALVAGGVGIYRQFINPNYLFVQGVKVPKKMVFQAYYQLYPDLKDKPVSKKNAIEAFLLRQSMYEDYLDKTSQKWIMGTIQDIQTGYTTDETFSTKEKIKRFVLKTEDGYYSVHSKDQGQDIRVGQRIAFQLSSEFSELINVSEFVSSGNKISIPFSSGMISYHHL